MTQLKIEYEVIQTKDNGKVDIYNPPVEGAYLGRKVERVSEGYYIDENNRTLEMFREKVSTAWYVRTANVNPLRKKIGYPVTMDSINNRIIIHND